MRLILATVFAILLVIAGPSASIAGSTAVDPLARAQTETEARLQLHVAKPLNFLELAKTCQDFHDAEAGFEAAEIHATFEEAARPDQGVVDLCRALSHLSSTTAGDLRKLWMSGLPSPAAVREARPKASALLERARKRARELGVSIPSDTSKAFTESILTPTSTAGLSTSGKFLWGLTDVLVRRASEELDVWLLDRLRKEVCRPSDAGDEFRPQVVLEETCQALDAAPLLSDLPGGISTLQSAARHDVETLVERGSEEAFRVLIRQTDSPKREDDEDALLVLSYLGRVLSRASDGHDLLAALREAPNHRLPSGFEPRHARAATAMYQLSFILQSLSAPDSGGARRASLDDVVWVLGASLVNAEAAHVPRDGWLPESVGQLPKQLGNMIESTTETWNEIDEALQEAEAARRAKDAVRAYARALDRTSTLLQDWVAALCPDAERGDDACKRLVNSRGWQTLTNATPFLRASAEGRYGPALLAILEPLGRHLEKPLSANGRRALAFAVSIAEARDAKAASAAIDAFIAPRGSYRGKRENLRLFFGVNAYAGAFLAEERVEGETAFAYAPWVPIGFEVGQGSENWHLPYCPHVGSTSLFLQVIDVGALASYRVNKGNVDSAPDVGFRQVLSPGAFVVFGFKNAPLSLGIGAAYAPELRRITNDGGQETSADSIRYGLTLAFDIPLLP